MKWERFGLPPPGWQWPRRLAQIFIILLLFALPVLARYHNYIASRKVDEFIEKWEKRPQGKVLAATDKLVRATGQDEESYDGHKRRNRKEIVERLEKYRGSVWSMELAGISMTDPLAGAESIAASKAFPWVLFVSLIIPVIATVLLGRVFCTWICPMNTLLELTDKLRKVLRFLELPPRNLLFWRGNKYVILLVGLAAALILSVPLMGYFYPPAVIGREVHAWVNEFFDWAEQGRPGVGWTAGLTIASGFILAVVLLEVFVSRRLWCRYLCPGGALYAALGAFRVVRVKRDVKTCTDCAECGQVCGMGLNPMRDWTGVECDNCALCVTYCEPRALSFKFGVKDPQPAGAGHAAPKAECDACPEQESGSEREAPQASTEKALAGSSQGSGESS